MREKKDIPAGWQGFAPVIILLVIVGLAAAGYFVFGGLKKESVSTGKWSEPTKILNGYADADVVALDGGGYRMYFGDVPSSKNFVHGIFSATSSDSKSWKLENGIRQSNATFPDVVRLKDGSFRMYFQGNGGIQSSVSKDGLIWSGEPGVRIDASNDTGLKLTQVGAPTTIQTDDGTFVMVYRGTISDTYDSEAPNKGTNLLLWAKSSDGLIFQKQGIAVDSRNTTYNGFLDGPDFSKWDDGYRLYFWTYSGIYFDSFNGNTFRGDNVAIKPKSNNPRAKFVPNPPGDPSLVKVGAAWHMYYGSNNAGDQALYYVTLNK